MIISCENCNKRFEVSDNLIPEQGRLLQCSSCDHKWFFKKTEKLIEKKEPKKIIKEDDNKILSETFVDKTIEKEEITSTTLNEETLSEIDDEQPQVKKDKKTNYLKIFIVIIITFVAIIIIIDTFKNQIRFIYPDIEIPLNNLYESLRDINLFLRDLISQH